MSTTKLTQPESGYISAWQVGTDTWSPSTRGIRCGTCRWFVHPFLKSPVVGPGAENHAFDNGCRIVEGRIDSQGCCSVWNVGGRAITLVSQRTSLAPRVYAKLEELLRMT